MNDQTDSQLLCAYVENRSEAAFAELVRRHVDIVYSAARRMVCDPHLAEDVTQGVFVAFAKNARQLTDRSVFSGWLHRTAQNIAAQTIRTIERRRAREQEAFAMNELLAHESDATWKNIAPLLDAALGELSEPDRDALLLRYFEKKSAREMAGILNVSEEAAQKRVNRAVERLRELFSKRNVTIGASGPVVVISTNAVQAAPIGLAATISSAVSLVGAAVQSYTAIAATKTIAMTTLQKTIVTATIGVLAAVGIYESQQISRLREQNLAVQRQQLPLTEEIQKLQQDHDAATNRLASLTDATEKIKGNNAELLRLRGEVTQLRSKLLDSTRTNTAESLTKLVEKVNKLKQRLEQTPNARIPELQYLTELDWLNVANKKLDAEADYRRALASLRTIAKNKFGQMYRKALKSYSKTPTKQILTDVAQLQPYFDPPVDDAVLQRWKIEQYNAGFGEDWVISEKTAVDEIFDSRDIFDLHGSRSDRALDFAIGEIMAPVRQAFNEASNGKEFEEFSKLLPYATTPEQQAAVQKMILRESAND